MITSRDNERLKRAHKLLRSRKHRDETGLFACEGEDLVDAARGAELEPVDLLVAGENVAPELLASVSTLPHPARVIGVYARAQLPREPREVCLGLWRLVDPGNVGTLLRTADAFGAAVALSAGCADPVSPKALRASAGAIFRVPLVPWEELPDNRVALVSRGGTPLVDVELTPPVALLLGSERDGLPEHLVTISYKATIPLSGGVESLNVAAAGAIALYELSRRS
ncbi:MAG: RNA methyltransferase [Thermoleophilia bacterium]|nr:RNA methyltransferase [Thermoleophilia bacterium]MDH4345853.1 RNA methyltransferase [Thermoleophilia bacterium]